MLTRQRSSKLAEGTPRELSNGEPVGPWRVVDLIASGDSLVKFHQHAHAAGV